MSKAYKKGYLKSLREYQDKMYLPGFYTGGNIHPILKSKTKAGGYAMIITGIFMLLFYSFQLFSNFSPENIGWIMPIAFALLLMAVGVKFIIRKPPIKP